jgi:hypothetical protein
VSFRAGAVEPAQARTGWNKLEQVLLNFKNPFFCSNFKSLKQHGTGWNRILL